MYGTWAYPRKHSGGAHLLGGTGGVVEYETEAHGGQHRFVALSVLVNALRTPAAMQRAVAAEPPAAF